MIFLTIFAPPIRIGIGESVAQQVEHNTFNVGVPGSSPGGFTEKRRVKQLSFFRESAFTFPLNPPLSKGDLLFCYINFLNVRAMLGLRVRIQPNSAGYVLCNAIKSGEIRYNSPRPPHFRNDRNADKRSAYRFGQQDAWASKP